MRVCTGCAARAPEASGRFCPECGASFLDEVERLEDLDNDTTGALVGHEIDRQFVIESVIGGGSFGTVYRARQIGIDRAVALKIPTHEIASDPVMTERFAREARNAARIHHPGVVAIYVVGELADGRPYLAMEFVEGRPLTEILASGPIRATRALGIARQIASALSDTHAAGVIHRDLKPSNIIWRRDRNGDDRITLVDFGIAVCKTTTAEAARLTAGGLIGTPHYMAPEQAQGEAVDARADLYALGCVLFELLTGTTPFDGSGFEVLLAHMGKSIPPPSERAAPLKILVPPAADRLVVKLLQKKAENRPQTADEVVALIDAALDDLEDGSLSARTTRRARRPTQRPPKPSVPPPPLGSDSTGLAVQPPPARSKRRALVLALLAVVLVGAGGFAAFKLTRHEEREYDGPTRRISADEGELNLIAVVPAHIAPNTDTEVHLAIRNKLGQPAASDSAAIMVVDPRGAEHGYAATSQGEPGHYHFHHTFGAPGAYTLRVFTSPPDTRFEIRIDVDAK